MAIEHGALVAIIGAGGPGRATLLATICGLRPPAAGEVVRADDGNVGYVPRGDLIHPALPLARALRYAAGLRHLGDPRRAAGDALRILDLSGRSLVPAGRLSGGERKRASIAAEYLAGPGLVGLDEPTSGLDPARGAELMRTLRRLCDGGATVVLTTQSPLDVEACDKIVVLASGGDLAFFGPPAAALAYFGTDSIVEIYERLAGLGDPARNWSRRFLDSNPSRTSPGVPPARPDAVADSTRAAGQRPARWPATAGPARAARQLRQWALLTQRNADILTRGKLAGAALAGAPLAVLATFLLLLRPGAVSPAATVMIIFWLAFGGFFLGLAYGLLAICTEWGILRRERLAGLGAGAYVLAKVSVLLPLLAVADFAFLAVLRLAGRLPAAGDNLAVFVTVLLCSASALGLGLLISAAVSKPSQATIVALVACFPPVLFTGAVVPPAVMAIAGRWISYAMTTRWAFDALGHSLALAGDEAAGASPAGRRLLAPAGMTFSRPVAVDWLVLAGFTLALLAATIAVIVRKTRWSPPA